MERIGFGALWWLLWQCFAATPVLEAGAHPALAFLVASVFALTSLPALYRIMWI
ncbi:MAG: hypothetical protein R3215_15640 [Halomonas sp.]|nr:hypothetical protein [Halomonas sp.]